MKRALAVALAISLVGSALPVAAQQPANISALPNPLVDAGTLNLLKRSSQTFGAKEVDWKKVRDTRPGDRINLTLKDGRLLKVWLVWADERRVTVLDLEHPTLGNRAKNLLEWLSTAPLRAASVRAPDSQFGTQANLTLLAVAVLFNGEISMGSGDVLTNRGLFNKSGELLADMAQIVETVTPEQVAATDAHRHTRWIVLGLALAALSVVALALGLRGLRN